jgi:hypothetical protein
MGPPVKPLITETLANNQDPEVQMRCREVLTEVDFELPAEEREQIEQALKRLRFRKGTDLAGKRYVMPVAVKDLAPYGGAGAIEQNWNWDGGR